MYHIVGNLMHWLIAHFLFDCIILEIIRQHILKEIKHILRNCGLDLNNSETLLRLLIDCSAVIDSKTVTESIFHIRRICYALHIERNRRLSVVLGRKRNRKTNPENPAPVCFTCFLKRIWKHLCRLGKLNIYHSFILSLNSDFNIVLLPGTSVVK